MIALRLGGARTTFVVATLLSALAIPSPAHATSPYLKDVCASGCTYSSVQSAVDSITDSGPDKVYTVLIEAGILTSNSSTAFGGKSYINLVGRGMGTSILRATSTWFTNVNSGAESHPNFVDLTGSTNVKIANLSIDARTNTPGGIANNPAGVGVDNADRITIDGCQIEADVYGVWEFTNSSSHLIEVLGSKIRAITSGIRAASAVWHIFSSEVKAVNNGEGSGTLSAVGLQVYGGAGASTVLWGSHIHGESSGSQANDVQAVYVSLTGGAEFVSVGSTLHAKLLTASSPYLRYVTSLQMAGSSSVDGKVDVVGSQLIFETPTGLTQGYVSGILFGRTSTTSEINLAGGSISDMGGSGGYYRADVLRTGAGPGCSTAPYCMPAFHAVGTRVASVAGISGVQIGGSALGFDTVNDQRGASTFATSNTATVTLAKPMPDTNYRVAVSANANETVWVTGKTATQFTLNSSAATSTATVEWIVSR